MISLQAIALLLLVLPQDGGTSPLDIEGPLNNDTFAATNASAQEELARGDRSWLRALEDRTAGTRERGLAFEAWRTALEVSKTGDAVALRSTDEELSGLWADPEGSHGRRTEGVSYAVLRRLHAVDARAQQEWTERFGALADAALAGAGSDGGRLGDVERNHPWTRGAALAGLRLADLAFERGATVDARAWLERALEHATGIQRGGGNSSLQVAIDARLRQIRRWIAGQPATPPARVPDALDLVRGEQLEGLRTSGTRQSLRGSLQCGMGFTGTGSVIIQSPIGLVHYRDTGEEHDTGQPERPRTLRSRFRDLIGEDWNTPFVTTAEGGWPLLPAVLGDEVVVVVGRSIARTRGVSFAEGDARASYPTNVLARFHIDGSGLPEIGWSRSGAGLRRSDGSVVDDNPFDTDEWEIQPGPCLSDGRVFVQVRLTRGQSGGDQELWLWAFDLASGEALWSRFLTKPSDLPGAGARSQPLPTPAQPLAVIDGRIFAGTNTGLGVLLDGVDGRLVWSFRNRRRQPSAEGWTGARSAPELAGTSHPMLAWTPSDSDRLYVLSASPDLDGRGILRRSDLAPVAAGSPYPIGSARELARAASEELVVLGRSGPRQALSAWTPDGGRRSSIYLGRDEAFSGAAWTSAERLLTASDRYLYLFDQELRLLDSRALPDVGGGRGGTVYVRGGEIFVLGQDTLWHFRAR